MRNYAKSCHDVLIQQLPKIKDIKFYSADYKFYNPNNAIIYCDPPYVNTTKYGLFKGFDHIEFWNTMRKWSENNIIFISEYVAPDDFKCVLEIETKTALRNKDNNVIPRIERLFSKN